MNDPNAQVKKRQLMLVVGSIFVIFLLMVGGMFFFEKGPTVRHEKPKTVSITAPGTVEDKDAWMAQEAAKSQSNSIQINELKAMLLKQQEQQALQKKLQEELENKSKIGNSYDNRKNELPPVSQPLPVPKGGSLHTPNTGVGMQDTNLVPPLNSPLNLPLIEVKKRELEIIQFNSGNAKPDLPEGNAVKKLSQSANAHINNSIEFIPAGSFIRVALLNGIDAPTGGQAQSNPLPIALHVLDTANLANKYKLDIRDCRFIAAAWGDLSSERAMARIETLTCIINGETVELPVKGQVIGEDGKAGIRGRLVTKQGQILANALLAGIASGIGKAFQQSATTQSVSTLGVTSTIQSDDVAKAAIGSGVGNAGTALEQYYLKAADKLYPVIETDGGRMVEILVTKGAVYNGKSTNIGGNYKGMLKRADLNSRNYRDEN